MTKKFKLEKYRSLGFAVFLILAAALLGVRSIRVVNNNVAFIHFTKSLMGTQVGNVKVAQRLFQRTLSKNPFSPSALRGLGLTYLYQKNIDQGQSVLENADVQASNQLVSWGLGSLNEGDAEEAAGWFRNATEVDKDNGRAWCLLGELLQNQGKNKQAITYFQNGVDAGYLGCVNRLALYHYEMEHYQQGIDILEKALAKNPDHEDRKEWFLNIVFTLLKADQATSALVYSNQALAEFPQEERFYYQVGLSIYKVTGDDVQAINLIKRAIQMNNDFPNAYKAVGDILAQEEQYDEAIPWYTDAIRLAGDKISWYIKRAHIAFLMGDYSQAQAYYLEIIQKFPDNSAAYLGLAETYLKEDKYLQGEQAIKTALDLLEKPDVQYLITAAKIFQAQGLVEKARDKYMEVLSIDPDNEYANQAIEKLGK